MSGLTSAAAANEAKVVEARYLVLHHTRGVPQLGGVVLVVARHDGHNSPIGYVSQGNHLAGAERSKGRHLLTALNNIQQVDTHFTP